MDTLAYAIKHRWPELFRHIASLAESFTAFRFKRRTQKALEESEVTGTVGGNKAQMVRLLPERAEELESFLTSLPHNYFTYFRPHRFDTDGINEVIRSRAYMNYGLYVGETLAGYALLKLSPTGSAYIGLLVHPDYSGRGLGTFVVHYLYWQATLAGLKARSTISRQNPASLKSHQAVADFKVVADLPNDYMLIEFPEAIPSKPVLNH